MGIFRNYETVVVGSALHYKLNKRFLTEYLRLFRETDSYIFVGYAEVYLTKGKKLYT